MSAFESMKCDSCGKVGIYAKITRADGKTNHLICRSCIDAATADNAPQTPNSMSHVGFYNPIHTPDMAMPKVIIGELTTVLSDGTVLRPGLQDDPDSPEPIAVRSEGE